jgi:outer membrane protein assembly factor BamB
MRPLANARRFLPMTASVLLALARLACGADWPQWRGPNRDGISPETGLLKSWPADGLRPVWVARGCGVGFSSIAVSDGLVYTAGEVDKSIHIIALGDDGSPKWRATNGLNEWRVPDGSRSWGGAYKGSRATPVVDDGLVYHVGPYGRLAAFEAATGREVWAIEMVKKFRGRPDEWGYAESVLIDGSVLYCYPGGPDGYMVALDKKTGKTIWANTTAGDRAGYTSASLVQIDGVRQVVTMSAHWVLGVDAGTGKLLWKHRHVNRHNDNCETPLLADGLVYVSSGYGYGTEALKVSMADGNASVRVAWRSQLADSLHSGMVLHDGYLYTVGWGNRGFFCIDAAKGTVVWRERFDRASVIYADGMLYAVTQRGDVCLVRARPSGFEQVSRFRLPKQRGKCFAHPAISGGRLYVRWADSLFAFDIAAR